MAWSNIPESNGLVFRANVNAAFAALYAQQSAAASANTVAVRDANGHLVATQFDGSGAGLTGTAANLTAGNVNAVADGANYNRLVTFVAGNGGQAIGTSSWLTYNPSTGRLSVPFLTVDNDSTPYVHVQDAGARYLNVGIDSSDTTYPGFMNSSAGIKFQTNTGSLTPLKLSGNTAVFGSGTPVQGGYGASGSLIAQMWCYACPITSIMGGMNISSISNPSGQQYSFNFATAMANIYYGAWGQEFTNGSDSAFDFTELRNKTVSGVTFVWHGSGGGGVTPVGACILVMC